MTFDEAMQLQGEIYRKQPHRETARVQIDQAYYFIKKHDGISWGECFKNWFSGRMPVIGAENEWRAIQALTELNIPTTPLVAYGKRGLWPFTQQSFVLTKALDNTVSLENERPTRDEIIQMANIIRTLHAHGWVHRDLYLCHFLRDVNDQLHLIDLHRMMQPRFCKQRWIIKDLAALLFSSLDVNITRHDVLRFLKIYTQLPLKEALKLPMINQVIERARALYEKSHHDLPLQTWMHAGVLRLPQKTGKFHETWSFVEGDFIATVALRVLQDRRWTMKGDWQGKPAILKLFTYERDYARELTGAQALSQHHILSPEILYQGKLGDYFAVIYAYIIDANPPEELTPALMNTMIQLHQAGLMQTDPHRDNFLLKGDKVYVLDAGGIKIYSHIDEKMVLENLAILYAQWPASEDAKHLTLFPPLHAKLIDTIENVRERGRNIWLKKIFRNCTAIISKTRFTSRYCIRRDFESLYTQTLLQYPEAYFHPQAHYLKQGNSATVVRTQLGDHDIVIKRFNRKNWLKKIKRIFTPSKGARAWKMSHAMLSIGIATPKPLAFIEKRFGPVRLDSYYICEFTPGERLDHISLQKNCIEALNDMMDALNTAMCAHGDLKASNLLWDEKVLYLLDTDGAIFYKNQDRFARAHEADWERLMRNWKNQVIRGEKKHG